MNDTHQPRPLSALEAAAPSYCVCCDQGDIECVCDLVERRLRQLGALRSDEPPMSEAERCECLQEIDRIEGHNPSDHLLDDDATLANAVLNAWRDFIRDKGMER